MDEPALLITLALFSVGYVCGTIAESKHFKSIVSREGLFLRLPAVANKNLYQADQVARAELATGSVVVSLDYFKRALAALRNIVGGRVGAYETLIDRARREALLRMKEQHPDADMIVNVRIETSSIGQSANQKNSIGSIEALAYGTAIWLKKS